MDFFKTGFVALFATLFCIWLLKPMALQIGFVDRPGGRKLHGVETPLIGGIAMFFGFCLALLTLECSLQPYRGLLAGSGLLLLMGVVDDFKGLGSRLRLVGQLFAAFLLINWGGLNLTHLGNLFFLGSVNLGMSADLLTLVCVVGFINAMNMLDGQDGLAASIALVQVFFLLYLALCVHLMIDVRILMIVSIILIAFLGFNMPLPWRKKAGIFMGDSGITFIAFIIAWFSVHLAQFNLQKISPITILWILALPLFDLVHVCVSRILRGQSPLNAGRDHVHHLLQIAGFKTFLSTFLLIIFSIVLGVIGLSLQAWHVPEAWQFLGFLSALALYLAIVQLTKRST